MKITITNPSGNIGSKVAKQLLDKGAEVTLLARNPSKVAELERRGARVVKGEQSDADAVTRAVEGADALLWVNPPDYATTDALAAARRNAEAAAQAVRQHLGVRVVMISSGGAEHSSGTGPIVTLHLTEEILKDATKNLTVLRCNYFMENVLGSLETIGSQGAIYSIEPGDAKFPQIATQDVAAVAAAELLSGESGTRVIDLMGPEEISHDEVAATLSKVLGRPVKHVVVPGEALHSAMTGVGFSAHVADLIVEMGEASTKGLLGHYLGDERRRGTTRFEEFAKQVVLPAYRAQSESRAKAG